MTVSFPITREQAVEFLDGLDPKESLRKQCPLARGYCCPLEAIVAQVLDQKIAVAFQDWTDPVHDPYGEQAYWLPDWALAVRMGSDRGLMDKVLGEFKGWDTLTAGEVRAFIPAE